MIVARHAVHGSERARPQTGARPVAYAEVHGNTDKRDVEAAEIRRVDRIDAVRRIEQRADGGIREFSPLTALVHEGHNFAELGVADVPTCGVSILCATSLEFGWIPHKPRTRFGLMCNEVTAQECRRIGPGCPFLPGL